MRSELDGWVSIYHRWRVDASRARVLQLLPNHLLICIATALGTCLWCSPRLADRVASLPLVPVVVIMAIYIAVQAFVPAMNPSPRNSAGAC